MKKIFSILSASALVVAMASCGGNKTAEADTTVAEDSVVGVEMEADSAVDGFVEEAEVEAPVEEVKKPAAPVKQTVKKEAETTKKMVVNKTAKIEGTVDNAKLKVSNTVTNAQEKAVEEEKAVTSKMQNALNKTKAAAEKTVSDADEKAKAWKEKKLKKTAE